MIQVTLWTKMIRHNWPVNNVLDEIKSTSWFTSYTPRCTNDYNINLIYTSNVFAYKSFDDSDITSNSYHVTGDDNINIVKLVIFLI